MAKKAQLDEVRPVLNKVNEEVSKIEGFLDAVEGGADKATDALEHGLEKVADVVPEVLDKSVHVAAEGTRKVARGFRSPKVMIISFGAAGALAGAALGVIAYRIQKKQIEKKLRAEFEQRLEQEIEAMQKFYDKRSAKKQPFSSPEEAVEKLLPKTREERLAEEAAEALNEYEGDQPPPGIISPENDPREGTNHSVRYDRIKTKSNPEAVAAVQALVEEVEPEEVTRNVFVQQSSLDDWDQDREEASRNPESPYVISHDEYMENSYEHDQNTLTYYVGDGILADERDQDIDEVEATVGVQNLALFGHGSRDSNIVYIRNERIEIDFEVTRNSGKYSEEVLGFQHSDATPRIRHGRGRRGDDG